jgi:hypothetical protein
MNTGAQITNANDPNAKKYLKSKTFNFDAIPLQNGALVIASGNLIFLWNLPFGVWAFSVASFAIGLSVAINSYLRLKT